MVSSNYYHTPNRTHGIGPRGVISYVTEDGRRCSQTGELNTGILELSRIDIGTITYWCLGRYCVPVLTCLGLLHGLGAFGFGGHIANF